MDSKKKVDPEKVAGVIAITLFILLTLAAAISYGYIKYQNKKEKDAANLKRSYYYQNKAFAMDISDDLYYLGSTHIDYKDCHIYLLAYKLAHPEAEITVDDITKYLGNSEYDDNNKLRIKNRPENIENYITWYRDEYGFTFVEKYRYALWDYYEETTGKKFSDIRQNDFELLSKLAKDFYNCPNKESYIELEPYQRKYFVDKEVTRLYESFSEGEEKAVFIAPVSDERLTFNSLFEQGKEYSFSDIKAIIEAYLINIPETSDMKWAYYDNEIKKGFIDCCWDGEYEYYLEIQYHQENRSYDSQPLYDLYMILNNNDGKLSICFAYEFLNPNTSGFKNNVEITNYGQLNISVRNGNQYGHHKYFLASDHSLNYLYTDLHDYTVAEDISYSNIGAERSFTMVHIDGSEVTVDGRGCEVSCYYPEKESTPYIYSIDVYNKDAEKYPEDSDEYQAVKKFYEDEGYVILSLEESEELIHSIEEKAGITPAMKKAEIIIEK